MVASLKFESVAGTTTTALDQVKIIILEDGTGNKYTLDTTANNLKVAYKPTVGNEKEYTVDGLAAALGKLLTIDGNTPGTSVLTEEAAKQPVVDALIPKLANNANLQTAVAADAGLRTAVANDANLRTAVAAEQALQTAVAADAGLRTTVANDANLRTAVATEQALQTAVAADAGLRTAVANDANLRTAVAADAGLQKDLAKSLELQNGLKEKLIADQNFKTEIKTQANAQDAGFQGAVKGVMSQPGSKSAIIDHIKANDPAVQDIVIGVMSQEQSNFTIPVDSNSPLSWDF